MNCTSSGRFLVESGVPKRFAMLLVASVAVFLAMDARGEPSLQQVLAQQNPPLSLSDVAMAWREKAPSGGSTLYGVHLTSGSDLYYDSAGKVLNAAERSQLGLVSKDWSWKSVTVPSEFPPGKKQSLGTPIPQPRTANLSVPELALGAPDVEQALFEDELEASSPAKGVLRIGIFQEVGAPIQVGWDTAMDGVWRTLSDGGRVWSLRLSAAGAAGIRVHFPRFECPAGAELVVYNADFADEAYGPFKESGEFWSPTCFGESVGIELYLPVDAVEPADKVLLEIDRITYQYRSLDSLAKAAGGCNKDLACEGEEWKDIGAAVGGIGYLGLTGQLWCTGALLADEVSSTSESFFLTADHCIDSQNDASFAEVYWLYGATACNTPSTVPLPSSVPRSSKADYLAGAPRVSGTGPAVPVTGTDVSLLLLRGQAPDTIPHAGYSTEMVSEGEDVTCIHHPSGDYKRISHGKAASHAPNALTPAAQYIDVGWTVGKGTTEPGSSGGPLFVKDGLNQISIAGQLYGGGASCATPLEPDYFGRLSASYPILEPWLTHVLYRLTIGVAGGGTVTLLGRSGAIVSDTALVMEGSSPVLSAAPNEGRKFAGWRIDNAVNLISANPITFSMTNDRSAVAVFAVTVTIRKSGDGSVTMNGATAPSQADVPEGSQVQLTASPAASSAFVGWQMDGSSSRNTANPLVFPANDNTAVTAYFERIGEGEGENPDHKRPLPICGPSDTAPGGSVAADVLLMLLMAAALARRTRRSLKR